MKTRNPKKRRRDQPVVYGYQSCYRVASRQPLAGSREIILRGNTPGGNPGMSPLARSFEVKAIAEAPCEEEDTTGGSPWRFIIISLDA